MLPFIISRAIASTGDERTKSEIRIKGFMEAPPELHAVASVKTHSL
jgi:hypothetical protein